MTTHAAYAPRTTHHHATDAPVAPFEHWYGFPKGTGTCSSVKAFSPSSLVLYEYQIIHPGGDHTLSTSPLQESPPPDSFVEKVGR